MFCPKCGSEVEEGAKFCSKCGCSLAGNEAGSNSTADVTKVSSNTGSTNGASCSAIGAGLLGIFLGCYGVHNFYLHYTGKAVAQLILGLLVVGLPVSGIWGLIEGIMILAGSITVDGNGNPIKRDI
jgi:TM2 domain-containing membrane protein YozV